MFAGYQAGYNNESGNDNILWEIVTIILLVIKTLE